MTTTLPPFSLGAARRHARSRCDDASVGGDRRDSVVLVVSELLGNAVRHGRPPVSYDVVADRGDMLVTVDDADAEGPAAEVRNSAADAESGRGLFLVAALSRLWGWAPTGSGKTIWARV